MEPFTTMLHHRANEMDTCSRSGQVHTNSAHLASGSLEHTPSQPEEEDEAAPLISDTPKKAAKASKSSKRLTVMGLDPSPELAAIAMVYFVQGILGLSDLALAFLFKDHLHVEPAEVAILLSAGNIPWMIKPLYGFLSDAVPLLGYRRRSYLMICGIVGSVGWLALATVITSKGGALAMMICTSLAIAFSDVVVDSIVVERARGESQAVSGSLQSLCWAASAVGGILSALVSGWMVDHYGVYVVFGVTATFPLIVSWTALLIQEPRIVRGGRRQDYTAAAADPEEADGQLGQAGHVHVAGGTVPQTLLVQLVCWARTLFAAVMSKHLLLPVIFIFAWQATPTPDTAMFYYYTNVLHFTPEFLGMLTLAAQVASLIGIAIYNLWLKRFPLRRMLLWAMVVGTLLSSSQLLLVSGVSRSLGISDELFVLGDSVILEALYQFSYMPILVMAARVCPEGAEATLFATLMSISNFGSGVGRALGAALTKAFGVTSTNFDGMLPLLAVCIFSNLIPAALLGLLPTTIDQEPDEGDKGVAGREVELGHIGDGDVGPSARLCDREEEDRELLRLSGGGVGRRDSRGSVDGRRGGSEGVGLHAHKVVMGRADLEGGASRFTSPKANRVDVRA